MKNLIKLKQIHIEGGQNTCFDYKYLGRKDILNKTIEKSLYKRENGNWIKTKIKDLKCFIVELETESGYLNQSYPNDTLHMVELSRKPISLRKLRSFCK